MNAAWVSACILVSYVVYDRIGGMEQIRTQSHDQANDSHFTVKDPVTRRWYDSPDAFIKYVGSNKGTTDMDSFDRLDDAIVQRLLEALQPHAGDAALESALDSDGDWEAQLRASIGGSSSTEVNGTPLAVGNSGALLLDTASRERVAADAWSHHAGVPPSAVVRPRSTGQVSRVLRVCQENNIAVIPYGGGTSLEGHTNPVKGPCAGARTGQLALVLDLSGMREVVAVRADDMDCTVQAGVRWEELNEQAALRDSGLMFAVDPGPGATIGGMVATGCSGTNAVSEGTMKDNVLRLAAVLADGRVVRTAGGRARKSSAGLDLKSLLVGSEGTLAVVTQATLRLKPRPAAEVVGTVPFRNVEDAASCVVRLLQEGVRLRCVELLDDTMVTCLNEQSGCELPPAPHLFFRFAGASSAQVEADADRSERLAAASGALQPMRRASDPATISQLWEARKVALWSAGAMREGELRADGSERQCRVAITDACVPVSRLADMVRLTKEDIAASVLHGRAPIVGHVGDGNFHCFLVYDPEDEEEKACMEGLTARMSSRAQDLGGTCTGEHGVGTGKMGALRREAGGAGMAVMRAVKASVDPKNILNPGKVY